MTGTKVIDILNTLNFVNNYNDNGLMSNELVTIDSFGVITLYNTQDSINKNTGSFVISNGGLSISSEINSSNVSRGGALTIGGGGAFSQDVYIGGKLNVYGNINNFQSLNLTGTEHSLNNTTGSLKVNGGVSIQSTLNATSVTAGGSLTISGGVGIKKDLYVDGTSYLSNISTNNFSSLNNNLSNITAASIITNSISTSNIYSTNNTLNSIFANDINVNTINVINNSNTISNIYTTGGNIGINTVTPQFTLDINGSFNVNNTNSSIHKITNLTPNDIIQFQNTNISGSSSLQFLNNTGSSKASFGIGNNSASIFQNTAYFSTVSGIPINLSAGGNTDYPIIINAADNSLSIMSTTEAVDTNSGALKISGGASVNGNLYVGGSLNINSPTPINVTNTMVSSNSTTGAMLLVGGLSIKINDTLNSNATSYTAGGGLTIDGGIAVALNAYFGGIIDVKSGSNNLNSINLQSIQFYSNNNNGNYSVIGSGNASRTSASFTPIRFTGWNDQTNPKFVINNNTIDTINSLNATNNSHTIGNIFITNGNIGINTTQPSFSLDINGDINSTGITSGDINFTGNLYKNGILYNTNITDGSLWISSSTSNVVYVNNVNVGINITNPSYALTVNGTINTTDLIVKSTTNATNNNSNGSIITEGGIYIKKSLNVKSGIIHNNSSILSSGTFNAVNEQITYDDVIGLIFDNSTYTSFNILLSAVLSRSVGGNYASQYSIEGIQTDNGWSIEVNSIGDSIDLLFDITNTGQIQYYSATTYSNFISLVFNFSCTSFYTYGGFELMNLPGGANATSTLLISSTQNVISNTSAALIIYGGVYLEKDLLVKQNISSSNIIGTNMTTNNLNITSNLINSTIRQIRMFNKPTLYTSSGITESNTVSTGYHYFGNFPNIIETNLSKDIVNNVKYSLGREGLYNIQMGITNIGDTTPEFFISKNLTNEADLNDTNGNLISFNQINNCHLSATVFLTISDFISFGCYVNNNSFTSTTRNNITITLIQPINNITF